MVQPEPDRWTHDTFYDFDDDGPPPCDRPHDDEIATARRSAMPELSVLIKRLLHLLSRPAQR